MVAETCNTSRAAERAAAEEIAWISLGSPAAIARLAPEALSLIERERPFGLVLEIDGIDLDRHRNEFPHTRRLSGGRARFGAWCRGVAYVFGASTSAADACIHLEHAPRIWGTRVRIARNDDDAVAWLRGQFRRYDNSGR